jgi:hypothetical protein
MKFDRSAVTCWDFSSAEAKAVIKAELEKLEEPQFLVTKLATRWSQDRIA